MKALTIHEYGGPELFRLEEIDKPTPGDHQVLVAVKNSSINPVDWKLREGKLALVLPKRWPKVVGVDCAGVVEAVGSKVKDFVPGDEVFGMVNPLRTEYGAYAEYALCEKDSLAKKPDSLSFEYAASIPVAGLTAYKSLKTLIGLMPGQSILINGASGGVGTFAVQMAKIIGADITATCGPDNLEFVRSLGAANVIDYNEFDVRTSTQKFDSVFDASAKLNFRDATKVLRSGGIYVTTVPDPYTIAGIATSFLRSKKAHVVNAGAGAHIRAELTAIAELITSGQLTPVIAATIPLDQVPKAHAESATGHARGKTVISI